MPALASLVVTTDGKKFKSIGMSCPRLRFSRSAFVTFECVIGEVAFTRTALTMTSSSFSTLVVSCWVCCEKPLKDKPIAAKKRIGMRPLHFGGNIKKKEFDFITIKLI